MEVLRVSHVLLMFCSLLLLCPTAAVGCLLVYFFMFNGGDVNDSFFHAASHVISSFDKGTCFFQLIFSHAFLFILIFSDASIVGKYAT